MSTEELEEILRLDSQLPDDEENDIDAILYILEVIEKRKKENPTGRLSDVHSAWASFEKNYLPFLEDSKSLYDFEDTDTTVDFTKIPFDKLSRPQGNLRFKRFAFVAAALIAIVFTGTITASALGIDLWGAVAKWTKDTFNFSNTIPNEAITDAPNINADSNFESMEEALDYFDVTEKLAPTWFPDGYVLDDIKVAETPLKTTFTAKYILVNDEILVTIISYSTPITKTYEKDNEEVVVYTVENIEHFIMTNLDLTKVIWKNETHECSISGSFSSEEAENMINSIYERK